MPEPEEEVFDAGKLAAEIEAQEPEPAEEEDETAASEEPAAEEVTEASADEDEPDEEKWAAQEAAKSGGKSIALPSFQKRLARWKKQNQEGEAKLSKLTAELEAARKSQPVTPEQVAHYRRLQSVFGNLDKHARSKPWLAPVLLAIGEDKEPDWAQAQKDMASYLESVPKGDPILYQQVQQLKAMQEEFQNERMTGSVESHVRAENEQISKLIGNDPTLWAMLNEQALNASGNSTDIKSLPNRVKMAERMLAWAKDYSKKQMKSAIPTPAAKKAGLQVGRGAAATASAEKDDENEEFDPAKLAARILAGKA